MNSLIREVSLFASLPPEELENLSKVLHTYECPPGTLIFREDDPTDRFSIIIEGQVEVLKAMGTPEEHLLAVLGPGDFLGEMSMLYEQHLRSASARAQTFVRLLEIDFSDLEPLLHRQPLLALRVMQEMGERLRNSENKTIQELQEKNRQLALAYQELKAAQEKLIEQEKLEHELAMARRIQEEILPKELPRLPGWSVQAFWRPAHAVSGDFYDFFPLPEGRLGIVVGDVTDKGVPAALVMAITRSTLRSILLSAAASGSLFPGALLAQANELLVEDMPLHMFVTCLLAILDPHSGRLVFANAGHNYPYQKHGVRETVELRARGMPLGLLPGLSYEEVQVVVEPGDSLVFYSDGIVEAHNPQGEMFGFERMQKIVASYAEPTRLAGYLLEELSSFTGPNWEQEDDVTLVTLKRTA